jgi:hypothetical protein
MTKPKVFLSYSSEDREIVNNLAAFVRKLQVELKLDEEILSPANPIGDTLREQIQSCHGCLWVLTENSLKSDWCLVEVGAFWGAGKPVIIYNPSGTNYGGPFSDIKQAKDLDAIERAIKGLELRGKTFSTVTVQDAAKIIETSVNAAVHELSDEISLFREHLPAIRRMVEYLEVQNTFLSNHAALLSKITEIVKRAPKRIRCAFDVPSFGSISAESEFRKCCDVFDMYIATEEWDVTIFLLPADVGIKIVNAEFSELERQRKAWAEDVQALQRFHGYAQRAVQRGRRNFKVGWLAVNRDADGSPSGIHSMPLNVWVFDDDEAVFSTVINNYHPTSGDDVGPHHQEIGFSTRNKDMVRFLSEIVEKYAKNIDETITLAAQIAASEEVRARIDRLM